MRHTILSFLLATIYCAVSGQINDTWTAFWNKDSTMVGFKDKNGIIKIAPMFKGFTSGARFENIIAVMEVDNGEAGRYYLTKSGKIVGRDSLHMFDNGTDCESEGFIRFRDGKTDKAGMFNRNGDVAIPAEYNELTRVRNGMITAIKGATKKILGRTLQLDRRQRNAD